MDVGGAEAAGYVLPKMDPGRRCKAGSRVAAEDEVGEDLALCPFRRAPGRWCQLALPK